ncbi:MAG: OmpA family protein [Bacteroidota bacterium]
MKKTLFTILCILFFCLQLSFAQSPERKNALSYSVSILDYYSPFGENLLDPEGNQSLAAKIAYHRNLTGPLNLEIPFRLGKATVPTPLDPSNLVSEGDLFINADALLQLQFFRESNFFVPYLSAGLGLSSVEGLDTDFQIPLGVGLDFRLSEGVYLHARSDYRVSTTELAGTDGNLDNFIHNIGVKVFMGKGTQEPEAPADRDGDGVSDLMDACPDEAGLAALKGCPDRDSDGVADADDTCPDVAGEKAFAGCPDTDGDTVQDSEDVCPTVAGLAKFQGCPDTDGDGIQDSEDKCPNVFGTASFGGCPDTDGDGIEDAKDQCPDAAGIARFNGCPDTDGDGIADREDDCPEEAGSITNKGCPIKEISEEDKETLDFVAKNIQFETNSSFLKTGSSDRLDQVADILSRYPEYNVNIDGYTDSAGKDSYNQWLSERRAERCYNYLLEKGIAASRMKFTGYGEASPIADNGSAEGRRLNRRVEFNLYPRD